MSDPLKPMLARQVVLEHEGRKLARGTLGFDGTYFIRTNARFPGDRVDLPASLHRSVRLDTERVS